MRCSKVIFINGIKFNKEGKLKRCRPCLLMHENLQCYSDVETKDKDGRTPINVLYESCHANVESEDKNKKGHPLFLIKIIFRRIIKTVIVK